MKLKPFLPLLILCCLTISVRAQKKELEKFSWLAGSWMRTNARAGQSGFENWSISGDILSGRGITIRGTDTVFVEKLSIIAKGDDIFYVADVPNNKAPVYFRFTLVSPTSFVCENAENDFPKKIAYYLAADGSLKATISGGGRSIDYLFTRKK